MSTADAARAVTVVTDSGVSALMMSLAWALVTAVWVFLNARMRPQNSSFGWRSLFVAVSVFCGAQCASYLLVWWGDPATARVMDLGSKAIVFLAACVSGLRLLTPNHIDLRSVNYHLPDDLAVKTAATVSGIET